MDKARRSWLGAVVALAATGVSVTSALAQPGDILYPKTCNNPACVASGNTSTICDIASDVGCCCKFSGQSDWACQCVDETTCLTSTNCRANIPGQ